jgi:YD repeat-containing protein
MKTRISLLLSLTLLSVFFGNCTKKSDTTATCRLALVVDGSRSLNYSYENNRVSVKIESGIVVNTTNYVYNGSRLVTATTGTSTVEYTYDANGRLSQVDYKQAGTLTNRDSYQYTSNSAKPSAVIALTYSGTTITSTTTTNYTWTNGNLTQSSAITGSSQPTVISYTYDSKSNPELNLGFPTELVSKNNVVSKLTQVTGLPSTTALYTYTFNSQGYPLTSTEQLNGSSVTTTYTYNNCSNL